MSGTKTKIYYWDSCIYLAWIKGEDSHGRQYKEALRQIAHENFEGKNIIITSTITQIEVLDAKLTDEQKEQFRKTFRSQTHIQYDVDPPIAQKARQFREQTLNHISGKKLSTPDAIHLATAAIYNAAEVHTFDDGQKDKKTLGLLELNGDASVDKIVICKPTVPQRELGLATIAPEQISERRIDLDL
jgi:predicted nucleic acid-binding protein